MLPAVAATIEHTLRRRVEQRPLAATDQALIDLLTATMGDRSREQVRALFLDRGNHLLRYEVVSDGTVGEAALHPRELLRRAIELEASAVVIAHNHPGGCPEPSAADVAITRRLIAFADEIQLAIHDHIIVAGDRWISMRARGLL